MHLITALDDIERVPLAFEEVKGILRERLQFFLDEYAVSNISSFGVFILIEDESELSDHRAMMLTDPIIPQSIEWIETIVIGSEIYKSICIVRDDTFAVNIYARKEIIHKLLRGENDV